ncbi:hypothetical protein [Streptomyces sp. SP18BB07]|uniref:hypothetical protein n=1 Tax=Streptomyces sp. SP18BB07 TaxID=3002522 RepID=UPI002E791D0D|nr:hypothetical protein [Streptomyces sp. SP18BB07]MEE1764445.1 hypothetical protein [Streptomyces sp. SP18BB07]
MSTRTPTAAAAGIDAILMGIPYGEWVPMPEVAVLLREAELPRELLTAVVRKGRRRGVLRTRPTPEVTYVKRVHDEPKRS